MPVALHSLAVVLTEHPMRDWDPRGIKSAPVSEAGNGMVVALQCPSGSSTGTPQRCQLPHTDLVFTEPTLNGKGPTQRG